MLENILLTYTWNRVAYNILRSLSRHHLNIVLADASKFAMSRFSKYATGFCMYPSFYSNPQAFVKRVKEIILQKNIQVYFPVHEDIFVIARYLDKFSTLDVKIPIECYEKLKFVHLKNQCSEYIKNLGIPVPMTIQPKSYSEIKEFAEEVGFPLVFKEILSNSAKGIRYANNFNEAKKYSNEMESNSFIVQQYAKGTGYGVSILANHGELRAFFTHKRLREKTYTGGTSTVRESVRNELLENYAQQIVSELKWHGVAMIEFKFNEKLNKGWFIEMNPRFWGSLALPIYAGVDFPFLLYQMATEGDVKPVISYRNGVVMKWILGDVLASLDAMKYMGPKSFLTLFKRSDGYDDLYFDDPLPFFMQSAYYIIKFLKTWDVNPREEGLLDIESL